MKMEYKQAGNGGSGESHKTGVSGKFLGDTKGNRDLETNRSYDMIGGSGESHSPKSAGEFCGPTKGNADLAIDRTAGVSEGHGGGSHKAGGNGKMY